MKIFKNKHKTLDVFIHIPKAAGSSIRSLIESNYDSPGEQLSIYRTGGTNLHQFMTSLDDSILEQANIVYGHIPVVVHNYTKRHCNYFTFLRDPISRAISFFKYVKYDFKDHPAHGKFASGEVSFSEWCSRVNIETNRQTHMLAGYDRVTYTDRDMLEAAKKSLENFVYFGLMEEFEASVKNCAHTLGWDRSGFQVRNLSSLNNEDFLDKENASEEDINNLKSNNIFDIELYQFAKDLAIKKNFI